MITHYRCLQAICNTQTKTHRNLLHINGKIDTNTQEIQILMTEIYNVHSLHGITIIKK